MSASRRSHQRALFYLMRTSLEMYRHDRDFRARFEEWKARRADAQPATNEARATPTERPATGAAATV